MSREPISIVKRVTRKCLACNFDYMWRRLSVQQQFRTERIYPGELYNPLTYNGKCFRGSRWRGDRSLVLKLFCQIIFVAIVGVYLLLRNSMPAIVAGTVFVGSGRRQSRVVRLNSTIGIVKLSCFIKSRKPIFLFQLQFQKFFPSQGENLFGMNRRYFYGICDYITSSIISPSC